MAKKLPAVGERVAFSRAFLQSTGQIAGGVPFMRGKVEKLEELSPGFVLAYVLWDGAQEARPVNAENLVAVSRLHLEPV